MMRFLKKYEGEYDEATIQMLMDECSVSRLMARALIRRGIETPEMVGKFIHPSEDELLDPFDLPDMALAVARICIAIANHEKICVYGDYDADGVCATAILLRAIRTLGGDVIAYIPSRHHEGYGLNGEAIQRLYSMYVKLIVTVDNGIGAFDEIAVARNVGIDVVVTDHHSAGDSIPDCVAVVSASRKDSTYQNPYLCGAGVALKLAKALLPETDHTEDLAIAAVATVADVVPLVGENRAIVSLGLPHVAYEKCFRELLLAAGWKGQPVTSQTAAFMIAPRLNAAGRIGDAMRCVEMLLTDEEDRRKQLAKELDADNTTRKQLEYGIFEEAMQQADMSRRALIAVHDEWNPGIIGIVASRISEQYHRPAILFSEKDGVLVGSGRCPDGIHLFETLRKLSSYFTRYGGHARAAGITMRKELFSEFCEAFYALMDEKDAELFEPSSTYEEQLSLDLIDVRSLEELNLLAPFGERNPEPVFFIENTILTNAVRMGRDGAHLSATVHQGHASMRLVAFRRPDLIEPLQKGIPMDLTVRAGINVFRDKTDTELYLNAIEPNSRYVKLFNAILDNFLYNRDNRPEAYAEWHATVARFLSHEITRARLQTDYLEWKRWLKRETVPIATLTERFSPEKLTALLMFAELGFFTVDETGAELRIPENVRSRELGESSLFRLFAAPTTATV